MATATQNAPAQTGTPQYDAVVIGAGVAGLYQTYRLNEAGFTVKAFEAGSNVGGTWYWNRYPGARFDSEAEIYQYWFSKDMYAQWKPTERFPAQPETEKWLNHVADLHDLRKHYTFSTRVTVAHYDEANKLWTISTDKGETVTARFFISCAGMLSAPLENRFPGQDTFKGRIFYTARWPKDEIDWTGKTVGVVGTGATGIQVIQTIAPKVGKLKAFVRTPQYIIPMNNPKYSEADWNKKVEGFEDLKKRVQSTFSGFEYDFANGSWHDKTPAERRAIYEHYWKDGSLALWLSAFPEVFTDEAASADISEFVREKMRERLNNDPYLCEKLIPKPSDYGFGTHRVPLESKYLEAYLRPNVEIVDCRESAIERVLPNGVQMKDGTVHEVDILVLATGFDAGSGALSRIDVRGRGGRSLKEDWGRDIRTAMGVGVHGYPNLFTTGVPLAPSAALCNMTTCLQQQVDWISDCMIRLRDKGVTEIEATKAFEDAWVQHHDETANATLIVKTDSWYMGSNVEGKPRRLLSYCGGVGTYRGKCDEVAAKDYEGFAMS
ncbi:flavin-containing monooxygenase [Nevskia ramosa]|uniref:flavin-containing monooxygenase n=1 Tax=Nevskia ramosa TaxID=64002 RepID=UPI0003B5EEFE|nr:NAD(P)/FAD-dependent oxidoreductase [Nevskia ramosa]